MSAKWRLVGFGQEVRDGFVVGVVGGALYEAANIIWSTPTFGVPLTALVGGLIGAISSGLLYTLQKLR